MPALTNTLLPIVRFLWQPYDVAKGQLFDAILVSDHRSGAKKSMLSNDLELSQAEMVPAQSIPFGAWKNSTCDLCRLVFLAFCCYPVVLGQLMTRMNLNLCGRPQVATGTSRITPFKALFVLNLVYISLVILANLTFTTVSVHNATNGPPSNQSLGVYLFFEVFTWGLVLYTLYLTFMTRWYMRLRYGLPAECCGNGPCEDLGCACCCQNFAVLQMAFHTMDTPTQKVVCCNDTGLQDRGSDSEKNQRPVAGATIV